MPTIKTSVTFTILSPVESSNDVFDHLIEVRRHDTGEEGLLLCSHYCEWPKDLLPKATWIEGCFTPEEYKENPRLLLGYHRGSVTNHNWWQVGDDLLLEVYTETHESVRVPLHEPLNPYEYSEPGYYKRRLLMERLWRNAERHAPDDESAMVAYYREVVALVDRGEIHPLTACSYLPKGLSSWCRSGVVFTKGSYWGDHSVYMCTWYDRLKVVEDCPILGYAKALPFYMMPDDPGEIVGPSTRFPYRTL